MLVLVIVDEKKWKIMLGEETGRENAGTLIDFVCIDEGKGGDTTYKRI